MLKDRSYAALFLTAVLLLSPLVLKAAENTGDETPAAPAPAIVQRSPEEEKKIAERRKKVEERLKELNGSEWEMTVKPHAGKEKEYKDVFTFQDKQVSSKKLSARGFLSTNYTITIPDDGETAVWETMKTGKEGVVFIRGEWVKDKMTGAISEQLDEGKKIKEYSFSSKKAVAASDKPAEVPASEAVTQTSASTDAGSSRKLVSLEGDLKV